MARMKAVQQIPEQLTTAVSGLADGDFPVAVAVPVFGAGTGVCGGERREPGRGQHLPEVRGRQQAGELAPQGRDDAQADDAFVPGGDQRVQAGTG